MRIGGRAPQPKPEKSERSGGLTAAGRRIKTDRGRLKIQRRSWQDANWEYYDRIGEIHYGMRFKKNAIALMNIVPAEQPEASQEPIPTEDAAAIEAVERIHDNSEGWPALIGDTVLQYEVAGEAYVLGTEEQDDREEWWEVFSTEEIRHQGANVWRVADDGRPIREITADDYLIRLWRPHPRNRTEPDSTLRSVSTEAEELIILSEIIKATGLAQTGAGILAMPSEMTVSRIGSDDTFGEGDMSEDIDEFQIELIKALTMAAEDPSSVLRLAPLVIRGPGEQIANIQWLFPSRDIDEVMANQRGELLRRLANGIDLPAEVLEGKADLNHWTAWLVDESTIKQHVDPVLREALAGWTRHVYWPMLEAMGVPDPKRFLLWRDISSMTQHPNRLKDAILLYDRGEVSGDTVRRVAGFGDDDRPSDEEIEERRNRTTTPASEPDDTDETGTPDSENPAEASLVAAATRVSGERLRAIDQGLAYRIQAAADSTVDRLVEKAGARLRSRARKDPALSAQLNGVPNRLVGRTLGRDSIARLQIEDGDLISEDDFSEFQAAVVAWLASGQSAAISEAKSIGADLVDRETAEEALSTWTEEKQTEDRERGAVEFIDVLLALALAALFTPSADADPLGEGQIGAIPANAVWDAISTAGGWSPTDILDDIDPYRGIGNGYEIQSSIQNMGITTEVYVWVYGDPSARGSTFGPHYALDGVEYESWQDPALSVTADGSWLGTSHYYQGDHAGCLCSFDRTFTIEQVG